MKETAHARLEDRRLITGGGRYSGDLTMEGQAHGIFLRSPIAHGTIRAIDVTPALAMPGVIAVVTGADIAALGLRRWGIAPVKNRDGSALHSPERTALATDRVRFVGDPVALVIAETPAQAADAAESVLVDYDELPAITATRHQHSPAAVLWPHAPDNLAYDFAFGDAESVAAAFAEAALVVRTSVVNQRVIVASMEPRAAIARFDDAADRYEILVGSQGAAMLSRDIATAMDLPPEKIRVISEDVGGGFGMKTHVYPEYVALLVAARRVGRPVKWVSSRAEAFLADTQGRDTVADGELALDAEGNFLAIRIDSTINLGAYPSTQAASSATSNLRRCAVSVYKIGAVEIVARCVYTNTAPTAPYRGAGRPETIMLIERLVDLAAARMKCDPVELRRRNLIPAEAMPYLAANGETYDSGDFARVLERALQLADHAGFPARRAEAERKGLYRGLGIACYLEIATNAASEDMALDVDKDGQIHVHSGLQSNGQGHATIFPRIIAEELAIPVERITVSAGDSARMPGTFGSFGSRSLTVGGTAAIAAARSLIAQALTLAAQYLQEDRARLNYSAGRVSVDGTDRSVSLAEIARENGGITVREKITVAPNYPNGCQIAEIEIDPRTGVARFVSSVAVDDVGTVFDHALVDGQVHGGIAQGLGQVLIENAIYDPQTGQLLTGSFMDYALPRADDLPGYLTDAVEVPCTTNPLGSKGAGEAGTTGALAAGYNALMDALGRVGIEGEFAMPATPPRLWQALIGARASRP